MWNLIENLWKSKGATSTVYSIHQILKVLLWISEEYFPFVNLYWFCSILLFCSFCMCILHSRFSEFSARPTNGSFPVFFPHPFINRGNTFSTLQSNIFFRIYRILEDNNLGDHYHISHHFWKLLVEIIRPRYLSALSLISPLRLFYSAIYIFFSSLFFGITYKLDWMRIPDFQKQRFTWCSLSRFLQEQPIRYCLKDNVRENWSYYMKQVEFSVLNSDSSIQIYGD